MKKSIAFPMLLSVLLVIGCNSEANPQQQEQPKTEQPTKQASRSITNVEEFSSKKGMVVIKGFTSVGTISNQIGSIEVSAIESFDAASPSNIAKGVSITVKQSIRIEKSNTSFVDAEEIDGLISGIDYISSIKSDVTKQKNFEAKYRTNGNFNVVVFNKDAGELLAVVASGDVSYASVFVEMSDLARLKQLLIDAKAKL